MTATFSRTLLRVTVSGSPRERGKQQGEALREPIADVIARWAETLQARHGMPASEYIPEFLAATDFLPAINRYTPGLLDEVKGIAEGAEQPFETMLAYNLMDEEWAYADSRSSNAPGCTAIGLNIEHGAPVVAQTMDIPPVHDGSQVVIHHNPESGPDGLIFAGAGMLALNGANSAGIGVVVNNLAMLPSSRSGLPVMFMIRGVLERENLADAAKFVRETPHAIGQHYTIGSPDGFVGLEGADHGVFTCDASGGRFAHTNHPLAAGNLGRDKDHPYGRSSTFARQDRAVELLAGVEDRAGVERLLEDTTAPISREVSGGSFTFGGTSISCSVPPEMRVTAGPPHETEWVPVGFA